MGQQYLRSVNAFSIGPIASDPGSRSRSFGVIYQGTIRAHNAGPDTLTVVELLAALAPTNPKPKPEGGKHVVEVSDCTNSLVS